MHPPVDANATGSPDEARAPTMNGGFPNVLSSSGSIVMVCAFGVEVDVVAAGSGVVGGPGEVVVALLDVVVARDDVVTLPALVVGALVTRLDVVAVAPSAVLVVPVPGEVPFVDDDDIAPTDVVTAVPRVVDGLLARATEVEAPGRVVRVALTSSRLPHAVAPIDRASVTAAKMRCPRASIAPR